MAIDDLITNGGFEAGTLMNWDATNAGITGFNPHSGRYAAYLNAGPGSANLSQTVPVDGGESYQLIVSLAKYGFFSSPDIFVRVTFLDMNNAEVGSGLNVQISSSTLPNAVFNSWQEIYHTTNMAPDTATQARVEIIKPMGGLLDSSVMVDDVSFLEATPTLGAPGPTGPTGTMF